MAIAMPCLSPISGRRVNGFPSTLAHRVGSINAAAKTARATVPSFIFSSFPVTLCSYSKEKGKSNSNFLRTTTATQTPQSLWEEEEEEEGEGGGGWRKNEYSGRGKRRKEDGVSFFVGNLPYNVDSAELLKLFKDAGDVTMVEVIYNKETGRSRGFAFVTMATADDVSQCVERFNGYEYQGRTLRVSSGPPPTKNSFSPRVGFTKERFAGNGYIDSANKMYVSNLPWGADNLTLEQLFSDHGKVKDARIVYDRETGRSRGFGFVTMSSSEEVEAAISSLDGADMDGRSLRVMVAEPKPAQFGR